MGSMNEEDFEQKRAEQDQVDRAVAILMEHFDSVQIFVTRNTGPSTRHISIGSGNWFSRYGQVVDWLQWIAKQPPDAGHKEEL